MVKILAVDDEKLMIRGYERYCIQQGYELITAEEGRKGLELAISEQPDLIILDNNMVGMLGQEMIVKLKENDKTKDIPVIGHGDFPDEYDEHMVASYGKPNFAKVRSKIENVLKEYKLKNTVEEK